MSSSYSALPKIAVDLRAGLPGVRDQELRPLCLAYAASDGNSFRNAVTDELSVEFLSHYAYLNIGSDDYSQGLTVPAVEKALRVNGQPLEVEFPTQSQAAQPLVPASHYSKLFYSQGVEKNVAFTKIIDLLDHGLPIILGMQITDDFFSPGYPPVIEGKGVVRGGHAILAMGYGIYPDGERVLLIRNSWGETWGDGGYAWITEKCFKGRLLTTLQLS